MKEKKPRVKKIGMGNKIKASSVMLIVLSLVLTVALFFGLIVLQNKFSQEIVYQPILVAKTNIPVKTIITEDNIDKYFTYRQTNVLDITSGDLSSADKLIGRQAIVELVAGENVMLKDFEEISIYTSRLKNPIEISIPLGSIENSDGGKIRTGDIINITMMYSTTQLKSGTNTIDMGQNVPNTITVVKNENDETEDIDKNINENDNSFEYDIIEVPSTSSSETNPQTSEYNYSLWSNYVFKNLYVCKALDANGVEINPTNTDTATAIIIVKVEQEMEREINNALLNCSNMRVSKVLNKSNAIKTDENVTKIDEQPSTEVETETEIDEMFTIDVEEESTEIITESIILENNEE